MQSSWKLAFYEVDIVEIVQANTQAMLIINCNDEAVSLMPWTAFYQKVEWIQWTWTQYIKTNIVPSNSKWVYIKVSSQDIQTDLLIFGSRKSQNTRFWCWNSWGKFYLWWNNNDYSWNINANTAYEIKINYLNDKKKQVDNTVVTSNIWTLDSSNDVPVYIMAWNDNYSTDITKYCPSKIKLFFCKISDWSNIVAEFLPCYRKSDNVIGLYDTINNKFYTNSWSWTFWKWGNI